MLLLVGKLGCATQAPPPRGLDRGRVVLGGDPSAHVVRSGETLSSIARRYGTTAERLAELNRLDDPNRLAVGQRLRLPAGTRPEPERRDPGPPPPIEARAPDPELDCGAHGPAPEDWAVASTGLVWPADGVVLTRFGNLEGRRHAGLAIGAPLGTPVWASAGGEVVLAGEEPGYGRLVVLRHKGGEVTLYASLERACVEEGREVPRGALLGLVGVSSGVASPRLYFEVREGEGAVDPRPRLP